MAFTSGNDINILQPTDSGIVGAGAGNDTYILAQNFLSAGQTVTISDSSGTNTLQLIGGLTITSHKIAGTSLQLTLSNGAAVTVLGADNFNFKVGGNPLSGIEGVSKSFQAFATESLGATALPTGATIISSAGATVINGNGTTSITGVINPTTPAVGSAVKAPWTLMMGAGTGSWFSGSSVGGVFISDGSAAGTQLNPLTGYGSNMSGSSQMGVRFKTAEDQSKAYFYNINGSGFDSSGSFFRVGSVGISDGTAVGTKVLMTAAQNSYLPGNFVTVVGDRLVMAGGDQGPTSLGKILVSDGTALGTTLQTTDYGVPSVSAFFNSALVDQANQAVWFSARTAPFGAELIRFSYATGATPSTTMVKDIFPGSSDGISGVYSNRLSGMLLPNGKLIFGANDGVSSNEAWVSDGTNTGTFMLADFSQQMFWG